MVTNTHERRLWWRHLLSVLVAPVTMTLVIPALIVIPDGVRLPDLDSPASIALAVVGVLLIAGGLAVMVWTIVLFDRIGKGTLGVGPVLGEPVHLVVRGPYRHVRNPMITGVLCVLLGEAAITASGWLLGWFAIFFAVLATVIRFWEEPHLVQRYGAEYVEYRRNVPRWIPRMSPWR
ncbi:RemK protein [Mycobacterium sp. 1164966.3]|uniref:methyltransferase family protein n=1 Tax=Mycobacterium sp. 1164966.3 TaxID=1856861 RepID=UPI0007FD3416|nr:isoprenylcysteine carboxylmethyltransferase family protein [Mycobacterium sp. 1164966.3]OBA83896.1 RemK protein [Mycobacterium sp. 1164966.3]